MSWGGFSRFILSVVSLPYVIGLVIGNGISPEGGGTGPPVIIGGARGFGVIPGLPLVPCPGNTIEGGAIGIIPGGGATGPPVIIGGCG